MTEGIVRLLTHPLVKREFRSLMENGTPFLSAQELQNYITSKEIKLKPKSANIAGLQLADLIAHPAKMGILLTHGCSIANPPSLATHRIIRGIQPLYNAYGRVFLS